MFSQHKYPDCRLLYKTEEGAITFDAHMAVLAKSAYLDGLFRWKESVSVKIGKKYINQYNVDIPFDYHLMEFCLKFLYNKKEIKKIIDMDVEWYPYIFAIIDFLQLDNKYYSSIIGAFLSFIDKVTDSNKCLNIIQTVCNSNMSTYGKQSFVARTLYLLTEEHKNYIDKQYIQEHIYHGKSYVTDDGRLVVNNSSSLLHDDTTFYVSIEKKIKNDCKSYDYLLHAYKLLNFDITTRFFDRDDIYVTNPRTHNNINAWVGIEGEITKHCVCEFILTPKKTENPN